MTENAPRPFAADIEAELARRVKRELRTSLQRTRAATPHAARRAASEAIAARLGEHDLFVAGARVALFRPIVRKGEIDTTPIDRAIRAAGGRVAYPFLEEPPWDGTPFDPNHPPPPATMRFRWVDTEEHDELDDRFVDLGHGFPEPHDELPLAPPASIDVVIVPGLGFDPRGHRIGYGAGFYDRFLATARHARAVGVCFDFQMLAEVPAAEHDVAVTLVVTDRRHFAST